MYSSSGWITWLDKVKRVINSLILFKGLSSWISLSLNSQTWRNPVGSTIRCSDLSGYNFFRKHPYKLGYRQREIGISQMLKYFFSRAVVFSSFVHMQNEVVDWLVHDFFFDGSRRNISFRFICAEPRIKI